MEYDLPSPPTPCLSQPALASFALVQVDGVRQFVKRCMTCVGTNPDHASQLAELLVAADIRGHFSHGLNRLGIRV